MDEHELRFALHRLLDQPLPDDVRSVLAKGPPRRRPILWGSMAAAAACVLMMSGGALAWRGAPGLTGVAMSGHPTASGMHAAMSTAKVPAAAPAATPTFGSVSGSAKMVHMAPNPPSGALAPTWIRLPFGVRVKAVVAVGTKRHLEFHTVGRSVEVFVPHDVGSIEIRTASQRTYTVPVVRR